MESSFIKLKIQKKVGENNFVGIKIHPFSQGTWSFSQGTWSFSDRQNYFR
jgi:hypothetical protein